MTVLQEDRNDKLCPVARPEPRERRGTIVKPTDAMRAAAPGLVDALEPVTIAETGPERDAVFRLRHSVFVEELGRTADGEEGGMVHDEADDRESTILLYTSAPDGTLTGTMRLQRWAPGEVPEYWWNAYSMGLFDGAADLVTAEIARTIVKPDHRGALGLVSLSTAFYQLCAGPLAVDAAFTNCHAGLVRHYCLIGLRQYAAPLIQGGGGAVGVPLVGFCSDKAYLERVDSFMTPFVDVFFGPGRRAPLDIDRWAPLLASQAAPIQVDPDVVWERVHQLRDRSRKFSQPMIETLAEDTLKKLSAQGMLMRIPAGVQLTSKGLGERELFVITDGTFEVRDGERVLCLIGPGNVIGEVGFFATSGRRSASVYASTDGEVLALRRKFLGELREKDPATAAEILFLLARILADRVYSQQGEAGLQ